MSVCPMDFMGQLAPAIWGDSTWHKKLLCCSFAAFFGALMPGGTHDLGGAHDLRSDVDRFR